MSEKRGFWGKVVLAWEDYSRVLSSVLRGLVSENVTILASGMVYSTLIALIPCLTFLFTFLSSFGVLQSFLDLLEIWLSSAFGEETSAQLVDVVHRYSSNAMSLGVIGLASFLVTGISLVDKIYGVINRIFKTRTKGKNFRRYGTFLIFLIVFTFMISLSFALSNTVMHRFNAYVNNIDLPMTMARILRKAGSIALIWLMLFLFLTAVPNTKVRAKSAAIGATTGLVFVSIENVLFNMLVSRLVLYWTIYGTLASVFIGLLYIYIFWYIIIAASELTYVHQFRPDRNTLIGRALLPARTIGEAMDLILFICGKFSRGEGAATIREMSKSLSMPVSRMLNYLMEFESAGIILSTNSQKTSYIPSRPLEDIDVKDITRILYGTDDALSDSIDTDGEKIALNLYFKGEEGLDTKTIKNLLERK